MKIDEFVALDKLLKKYSEVANYDQKILAEQIRENIKPLIKEDK